MPNEPIKFSTIEEAAEEIRQGRMIVLVDDEDRENEGDLTIAAEKITPEAINFMAKYGRGLICLALTEQRCDELHLPLISPHNTSAHGTAFCESIDARRGTTTGISVADRAITILAAIDWETRPARRRAGPGGADGSLSGLGAHRRSHPRRGDLRSHERRRYDGARATTGGILPAARAEDGHHSRVDPLPHAARTLRSPAGGSESAHPLRPLPHDRLHQRCGQRAR